MTLGNRSPEYTSDDHTAGPDGFRHLQFAALGTYAYLATSADIGQAEQIATDVLAAVDRACSRFRPDSDLNRANAEAGSWIAVDPLLAAAVEVAIAAAEETNGLVDPCLGITMSELGYDADFGALRETRGPRVRSPHPIHAWREVRFDLEGALKVPRGVRIDLGATAKAWASDLVALSIVETTGHPAVVSLGGDLRIESPEGSAFAGWPVSISEAPPALPGAPRSAEPTGTDPATPDEIVFLTSGGLATSSSQVRRWTAGGVQRHHLIDPRTGEPAAGPWRTATATGPTCVAANIASTAALVLGAEAEAWLADREVDARLVSTSGTVVRLGAWPHADRREAR